MFHSVLVSCVCLAYLGSTVWLTKVKNINFHRLWKESSGSLSSIAKLLLCLPFPSLLSAESIADAYFIYVNYKLEHCLPFRDNLLDKSFLEDKFVKSGTISYKTGCLVTMTSTHQKFKHLQQYPDEVKRKREFFNDR